MEKVNGVQDCLVGGFGFSLDKQPPVEFLPVGRAGHLGQLFHNGLCFMRGDEPGGLHRVDDEFQFRQFQPSVPDEVLVLAAPVADDVPAGLLEIPDICRHRFPVGMDALGFQVGEDLGDSGGMGLICMIPEVPEDDEGTVLIRHKIHLLLIAIGRNVCCHSIVSQKNLIV